MVSFVVLVWIGGRRVDAVPRVLAALFVETEMKANCLAIWNIKVVTHGDMGVMPMAQLYGQT